MQTLFKLTRDNLRTTNPTVFLPLSSHVVQNIKTALNFELGGKAVMHTKQPHFWRTPLEMTTPTSPGPTPSYDYVIAYDMFSLLPPSAFVEQFTLVVQSMQTNFCPLREILPSILLMAGL